MVSNTNELFYSIYDRLVDKAEKVILNDFKMSNAGFPTNDSIIIKINRYIVYMENIINSRYIYSYVKGLTEISNYLNII